MSLSLFFTTHPKKNAELCQYFYVYFVAVMYYTCCMYIKDFVPCIIGLFFLTKSYLIQVVHWTFVLINVVNGGNYFTPKILNESDLEFLLQAKLSTLFFKNILMHHMTFHWMTVVPSDYNGVEKFLSSSEIKAFVMPWLIREKFWGVLNLITRTKQWRER